MVSHNKNILFKGKLWDNETEDWVSYESLIGFNIRTRAAVRIQGLVRKHNAKIVPRFLSMGQNASTRYLNQVPTYSLKRRLRKCIMYRGNSEEQRVLNNTFLIQLYKLPEKGLSRLIKYATCLADEAEYANEIEQLWGSRTPQQWHVASATAHFLVHSMRRIELSRAIHRHFIVKEVSTIRRRISVTCLQKNSPLCSHTTNYLMSFVD